MFAPRDSPLFPGVRPLLFSPAFRLCALPHTLRWYVQLLLALAQTLHQAVSELKVHFTRRHFATFVFSHKLPRLNVRPKLWPRCPRT
jgi:hypothetical protein